MAFQNKEQAQAYWRENVSLMLKLLAVWFLVSFGAGILFVHQLNDIQFFGFKLGFLVCTTRLNLHFRTADFRLRIQDESAGPKVQRARRLRSQRWIYKCSPISSLA